jgi:hypothetical protein
MKKISFLTLVLISGIFYSQRSSAVANPQNFNQSVANPFNLIGANPPTDGQWQLYLKDDLRWETYNINGLASYVQSFLTWNGILGKPTFANVSFTGSYNDLINTPTIPTAQVNSDWNSNSGKSQILNKPTSLAGYGITDAYPLTGNPSGFLTSFTEIDPTVPIYAKSLTGFGVIKSSTDPLYYPLGSNPAGYLTSVPGQVNADWNSVSGLSQILNKPTLATVATSGSYTDLINKPIIPSAQVNTDWNSSTGITQLLNKPTLSTVATSGSYVDLSNKPNIYSFSGVTGQYTRGDGTYATFPTVVSAFANDSGYLTGINSTQVTNALGYTPYNGTTNPNNYVTSSSLTTTLGSYATTSSLTSGLAGKENTITAGTNLQYWRGDKTWQTLNTAVVPENTNLYYTDTRARASNSAGTGISYNSTTGTITNSAPDQTVSITGAGGNTVTGTYPNFTITGTTAKRQVTFTGTTDASGNVTVTFSPAFTVAPNMQASISNQGTNTSQVVKVVSSSTTGATLNVYQRNAVTLLGIEILLAATVPVSGAVVDVLATEK